MKPELTKSEFEEKLTEIAKKAIKEYCINDDDSVSYVDFASSEIAYGSEFIENNPATIEKYCSGNFFHDDSEILKSKSLQESINFLRYRLFEQELDKKIKSLLDGEWDAIETITEKREIEETKTILND